MISEQDENSSETRSFYIATHQSPYVATKKRGVRIEASQWKCEDTALLLSASNQLNVIQQMAAQSPFDDVKTAQLIRKSIINKRNGYKQQDIVKKMWNEEQFVTFEYILSLCARSHCQCLYCKNEVAMIYEYVREPRQWTLDRIDNNQGHNKGNVVLSCLSCNLRRRRTAKEAFLFSQQMIVRLLDDDKL
jgi:hypothetical protein